MNENSGRRLPPHERLAVSLELLRAALNDGIYRSGSIPLRDFNRVYRAGYLREIMKGWYYAANPEAPPGATLWHGHFWPFVRHYLNELYGDGCCLAPEPSLRIHAGLTTVPQQLLVMTARPSGNRLDLPHGHRIVTYQEKSGIPEEVDENHRLRVLNVDMALARAPEGFFRVHPIEASALLTTLQDVSGLLRLLLDRGATTFAGRLAGAFRHVGRADVADRILQAVRAGGYDVTETNPFERSIPALGYTRDRSPYGARLRLMWAEMRGTVVAAFPPEPGVPESSGAYLGTLRALQSQDAYHSLSIEGFQVDGALIRRVRQRAFDPAKVAEDRQRADALAARGYYEAFESVANVVQQLLDGADPAGTLRTAHHDWHRVLFEPSVRAGILTPQDLAGYRGHQVYINGSDHVPLPPAAVPYAMDVLFELIGQEPHAAVRAVLGHFCFVFIHPYSDGNGRLGRFLMNAMFASGGYPWTVVHVDQRAEYMAALEAASTRGDITDLARFLERQMARTVEEAGGVG